MTLFAGLAVLLVVGVLGILLPPLFRSQNLPAVPDETTQAQAALAVLREQWQTLEADFASGKIDAAHYQETRAELERRTLAEGQIATSQPQAQPRAARAWAVGVALAVPLLAGLIYSQLGDLRGLDPAQTTPPAEQQDRVSQQQLDEMVAKLVKRLENEPNNIQGWSMLGRSYMVMGQFDKAAGVFAKLTELQPKSADPLADWAEALVMAGEGQVQGEPEKLALRALVLDPKQGKALALAGSAAYERQDYPAAVRHWEGLLAQTSAGSEAEQAIRAGVEDARAKGHMPPLASPSITPPSKSSRSASTPPALTLTGTVSLSDSLKAQTKPEDSVFIFARSGAGGPPLAALKVKVADLPYHFDFRQAQRMGEAAPGEKVSLVARVSKSGRPKASAGDFEGTLPMVSVDAREIKLIINMVMP